MEHLLLLVEDLIELVGPDPLAERLVAGRLLVDLSPADKSIAMKS